MSNVRYDAGTMTIEVDGLDDVSEALGELRKKSPDVLKVAINTTARQTRKLLIQRAKARYALTLRGRQKLNQIKQRKTATRNNLSARITGGDEGKMLNAVYFEHSPAVPRMGMQAFHASRMRARFLKGGAMRELETDDGTPTFLIRVHNSTAGSDHLMAVYKKLGSQGESACLSGKMRWRNDENGRNPVWDREHDKRYFLPNFKSNKLYEGDAIGPSDMGYSVWKRGVAEECMEQLQQTLMRQTERVLARAERKA